MALGRAVVSDDIRAELSAETLAEVFLSLYAADCQTCGRPLGGASPALHVTDIDGDFAVATLHHPACQVSEWTRSRIIHGRGAAHLSFSTASTLLTLVGADEATTLTPVLLLNPSLEAVFLQLDDDRWRVHLPAQFPAAGLNPPGPGVALGNPVAGAVSRTPQGRIAVTMTQYPFDTFEAQAQPSTIARVRELGGLLLVVTHAIDPRQAQGQADLVPVFDGDRAVLGWVELDEVRRARPAPAATPVTTSSRSFVLHFGERHLSVGILIDHAEGIESCEQAHRWAAGVLESPDANLLPWREANLTDPAAGWFALNTANMTQYLLRAYPDGWRLLQCLARIDGAGPAETDNEAKAWATTITQGKAQTGPLRWVPGPTPNGAITLYAEA
jgi:hypothetical protein